MALKPFYLGGRLRGYRDEKGRPVSVHEGQRAGLVPLAESPMVRRKAGGLVVTGGSDKAIATLTEMAMSGATAAPVVEPPKPKRRKKRKARSDKGKSRANKE